MGYLAKLNQVKVSEDIKEMDDVLRLAFNPENSSVFSARRAEELQNTVNLYVMSNS